MNNKYQAILAIIIVIGVIISYYTAESPYSIFGHKIHPSNCKCYVCNPRTQNEYNFFDNAGRKQEEPKPSHSNSSSDYSSYPSNSTYSNPYRSQPSSPVSVPPSPSYQEDNVKDPCGACNGSGRCTVCGGSGMTYNNMTEKWYRCDVCRQSGRCVGCGGRGSI